MIEEVARDDTSDESLIQGDDYKLADEALDAFNDDTLHKMNHFLPAGESL